MYVVWKLNERLERDTILFRSNAMSEAVAYALSRWQLDGKENRSLHEVEDIKDEPAKC
jgi:hypothetical protein